MTVYRWAKNLNSSPFCIQRMLCQETCHKVLSLRPGAGSTLKTAPEKPKKSPPENRTPTWGLGAFLWKMADTGKNTWKMPQIARPKLHLRPQILFIPSKFWDSSKRKEEVPFLKKQLYKKPSTPSLVQTAVSCLQPEPGLLLFSKERLFSASKQLSREHWDQSWFKPTMLYFWNVLDRTKTWTTKLLKKKNKTWW